MGRLLRGLNDLKVLSNTSNLFSSDNEPSEWPYYYKNGGTPSCSRGDLRARNWNLYECGIRVPFIAVRPGKIPAGKTNRIAVMSVMDIVPTMATMTGVEMPSTYSYDGINKKDVLYSKIAENPHPLFWYSNHELIPGKAQTISPVFAMRVATLKFLMNPKGSVSNYRIWPTTRWKQPISHNPKPSAHQP